MITENSYYTGLIRGICNKCNNTWKIYIYFRDFKININGCSFNKKGMLLCNSCRKEFNLLDEVEITKMLFHVFDYYKCYNNEDSVNSLFTLLESRGINFMSGNMFTTFIEEEKDVFVWGYE